MQEGSERTPGIKTRIADTAGQDITLQPRSGGRRWWIAGTVLSAAIFIVVLWPQIARWAAAEDSVPLDRVRLAEITRGDFSRDVSVQGRVVAAVSPTLYANSEGTITFLVNAGDQVTQGTQLARVDSPELTNQMQQDEAALARINIEAERQEIESKQQALTNQKTIDIAKLELTAAQRESRRAIDAYEREAISQLDYEKAQDDLESAEYAFQHAVADAELDNERLAFEQRTKQLEVDQQALLVTELKRQVDDLVLYSPVDGVVGNLLVDQKTNVARNQPVLSVVDLTQFEVEAQIPESYADDLAIGMRAEIINGRDRLPALLVSVSPEIIDNQVTARLRFQDKVPVGLRQNQRLTTRILLEEKQDVLMVERGQFIESGGGRIAYRVDGDVATRTSISIGARSLNRVEVLSGLNAGDRIIVSSTEAFDGAQTVILTD